MHNTSLYPKSFQYFLITWTFSYITTVQLSKARNSTLIQYYLNFISCPTKVLQLLFRPVQDLLQDHQLHVVVMSLFSLIGHLNGVDSFCLQMAFHLFKPTLPSLMAVKCSLYRFGTFLIKCIPTYFIFSVAIVNGVFPLP